MWRNELWLIEDFDQNMDKNFKVRNLILRKRQITFYEELRSLTTRHPPSLFDLIY
jgi:hypothetical protein